MQISNANEKWKKNKVEGWNYNFYKRTTKEKYENFNMLNSLYAEYVFEMLFLYIVQKLAPKIVLVLNNSFFVNGELLWKHLKYGKMQNPFK